MKFQDGGVVDVEGGAGRGSRGRGRGERARGRGRTRRPVLPNREEEVVTQEKRQEDMRERLSLMNADDLREVVFNIYRRNPSHVLDVLQPTPQGGGGHHPQPGCDVPSWCTCTFCRKMPSEEERVCCGETQHNCHSRLRDFDTIVLDELVLEIARRYRNDVLAQPEDENYNRSNRYAAYTVYFVDVWSSWGRESTHHSQLLCLEDTG